MNTSIPPKPHAKSRLEQQTLPHFFPEHSSLLVALALVVATIMLLPMGAVIIVTSDKVSEFSFRYDNISEFKYSQGAAGVYAVDFAFNGSEYSMGQKTRVSFNLSKSLSAPVFMRYRLRNFFQNYRWYGASIDLSQCHGGTGAVIDSCEPYRWPGEARNNHQPGYYNPCGAVPWSLFNDSISLYTASDELICDGGAFDASGESLNPNNKCVKKGISLPRDASNSFRTPVKSTAEHGPMWQGGGDASAADPFLAAGFYFDEPGHKIPVTSDEDFMVWANAGYTGDFGNNYRIIQEDLPSGEYYFDVIEAFDITSLGGKKFVQLVTQSWIGGRNHHLGILMVAFGGVSFVIAVAIVILRMTAFRKPMYL